MSELELMHALCPYTLFFLFLFSNMHRNYLLLKVKHDVSLMRRKYLRFTVVF